MEEIEIKATEFVGKIFKDTQKSYNDPISTLKALEFSSYTQNGNLVGYEEFEKFLDGLNKEELRLFFTFFVNTVHQKSYEFL